MRRTFLILAAVGLLVAFGTPASAGMARMSSNYGVVFMERGGADCTHEELWVGLREISEASLAPGSEWSDPVDTAWAWYECDEGTALYGESVLPPDEVELARLGDLSFMAELHMFDASLTEGESPPFMESGPSNVSTNLRGDLALDLTFMQEGRVHQFNFIKGQPVPPPPDAMSAPPGSITTWQYTGASIEGSITGYVEFDFESIVFAEIGHFTTVWI